MLDDENLADILETLKKMPAISKSNRDRIEEIISRGKTYGGLGNGQFTLPKESQEAFDALKLIKTQINTINHSSTTVLQYTNYTGTTFEDCLNIIAGDIELDNNFMMYYNVSCNDILKFLPYLELELLDICVHNQR